jgi:hypothetical protein
MQHRRSFSGDGAMEPVLGVWVAVSSLSAPNHSVALPSRRGELRSTWFLLVGDAVFALAMHDVAVDKEWCFVGVSYTRSTDRTWRMPDTARIRAGRRASGAGERPAIWRQRIRRVQTL